MFRNPTAEPVPQRRVPCHDQLRYRHAMFCVLNKKRPRVSGELGHGVYKTAILLLVVSNISKYM